MIMVLMTHHKMKTMMTIFPNLRIIMMTNIMMTRITMMTRTMMMITMITMMMMMREEKVQMVTEEEINIGMTTEDLLLIAEEAHTVVLDQVQVQEEILVETNIGVIREDQTGEQGLDQVQAEDQIHPIEEEHLQILEEAEALLQMHDLDRVAAQDHLLIGEIAIQEDQTIQLRDLETVLQEGDLIQVRELQKEVLLP
jgi:hypothetical protein